MNDGGDSNPSLDHDESYEINDDDSPAAEYDGMNGGHDRLHQTRLHANDHPAWLTSETRDMLTQYHLDTLEKSLISLKESIIHH